MKIGLFAVALAGAVASALVVQRLTSSVSQVISGKQYVVTMRALGGTFTDQIVSEVRKAVGDNGDSLDHVTVNPDGTVAVFTITYRHDGNLRLNTLVPDETDPKKGIFIENVESL